MKKKLLIFLIPLVLVLMTACGPKSGENDGGTTGGNGTVEVDKDVVGIYYAAYNGEISYYNDFYELKDDGTFTRQSNFCEGYKTITGNYTVTERNGVKTIALKDNMNYYDKEFYLELKNGVLNLRDENNPNGTETYTDSCGSENWLKGDASIVDRQQDVSFK